MLYLNSSRNRASAALVAVMTLVSVALCGTAEAMTKGRVGVELNKLESVGDACRAYLVLSNGAGVTLKSLKLDLVMFDPEGVVTRRLAVEAAPISKGKTSIKVFDIAGMACGGISRVLLNGVMSCADAKAKRDDCAALIQVSHRTKVPLFQ